MNGNMIRNIGIIAHVDHGKTTLVDAMLRQSGIFRENEQVIERIMDRNELERERGITIFSKNASIYYNDYKINIVDTPGHADFGGEVERILRMVDGVLLLVDACDGPMPQTRFVLKKSLELNLKPVVVINKIDRAEARPDQVLNAIFDLFVHLGANDNQLDFPVVYTSAKQGIAMLDAKEKGKDILPLFETVVKHVPPPPGDIQLPFQMLVTTIDYNNYLGRIAIGKIANGSVKAGNQIALVRKDGTTESAKILKLLGYQGLKQVEINDAAYGDIIAIAGLKDVDIGDTISDISSPVALPYTKIDEPTLSINLMVNTSPFAGQDGKFVTSTTWPYKKPDENFEKILHEERGMPEWEKMNYEFDLMIDSPSEDDARKWLSAGAERIVLHLESSKDLDPVITVLSGLVEIGVAINVKTDIKELSKYADRIQFIQCMGIRKIGYQGQNFDPDVVNKVTEVKAMFPNLKK